MTVQLTSLQLLMHILQNVAFVGVAVVVNVASRNKLSTTDRQRNYLDRMSTVAQQQRDYDREQHAEACARLTDQERQQERRRNHEQQAEARAWLTDQERQHERRRNREQQAEVRAQLANQERQQERRRNCEQQAEACAWLTYQQRQQQ